MYMNRAERLRRDALAIAHHYAAEAHAGAEIQLDPHVQATIGDERVVHGQQQYRGLSLYPHSFTLHIDGGRVERRTGDEIVACDGIETVPSIAGVDAVVAAFRHVREGTCPVCHRDHEPHFVKRGYRPRLLATFPMPNRPSVFSKGPFDELPAANLVLYSRLTPPRVAWAVTLTIEGVDEFTVVVDATEKRAGTILSCAPEAASATCSASVYLFNPAEAAATAMTFPRAPADYPASIRPANAFSDWVEKDVTHGNNVTTLFDNANRFGRAKKVNGVLTFSAAKDSLDEQLVNAFFICNFLHDLFALLGFGEADGNFQHRNTGKNGLGGDRLTVNILPASHGTANMSAQNDGKKPRMLLGTWKGGFPTAHDADVIIHEYAHGVSQRLVAGRLKKTALNEAQSMSMGEGWSDYFAVTIQNFYRPQPRYTFAAYSSNKPAGDRPHPYDAFPAGYGDLGTPPFHEQHGAGSVFAAALIRMQDALAGLLGADQGNVFGWRSVIASMKKLDANPTFLDGRDRLLEAAAKLAAAQHPQHAAAIDTLIRKSFAQFGMGRNARSGDTSFRNIVPDHNA
ncbi:MAG TPA: M36 family metallopeptidase [Thermoanaerobaculia bacterium]|nr:M36 family metallopeptidase [Thermoanaerobaculia bacterium]